MGEDSFNDHVGSQDENINERQTKNDQQQILILDSSVVLNGFWIPTKIVPIKNTLDVVL